ncbi:MAG: SH3 domain-containing protein [Deltaproteobacteria bacterium]|nr:SH3 domain-containing protein [Deltaproteobacteria bacterium]MBI4796160.1 SH3 domain-containing protein [Deltaproteobacteria bacterium]
MVRILFLTLILALILLGPTWASMASIAKENVNVRSAPNLQADVVFQVHFGYPVEIKQTKGSWVQIEDWDDNTGWVYRPLINRKVQTALVIPDRVNIRKGPGLKYPVVDYASSGEIYKIFTEKGNWIKIGYYQENSEVGWVRSDLVWGE